MQHDTIEYWQIRLEQVEVDSSEYWLCKLAIANREEAAKIAAGKYTPTYGVFETGPLGSPCNYGGGEREARRVR